jgi:hypothetical protein
LSFEKETLMKSVKFRLLGGNPVLNGTLLWIVPTNEKMVLLQEMLPLNTEKPVQGVRVINELGDIMELKATLVDPLAFDPPTKLNIPERRRTPRRFLSAMRRKVKGILFSVGDYVYFPNEQALRELTGHTEQKCLGHIMLIGKIEDKKSAFFVGFIANPQSKDPKKFLLQVLPSEIEVVVKRIPFGKQGLRVQTIGLDGEHEHDVQSDF